MTLWQRTLLTLLTVLACTCTRKPAEALLIAGSAKTLPLLREMGAMFKKAHPTAVLTVEAGGSTAAVVALRHKAVDIAALSRDLEKSEEKIENIAHPLALDAAVLIVHPTNAFASIKMDALAAILTGKVTNWSGVGGEAGQLHIIIEKDHGTARSVLDDIVLKGDVLTAGITELATQEEILATVAKDPLALGFVSIAAVDATVRALQVNAVTPTKLTILSGRYPLTRAFFLVHGRSPSPISGAFLSFLKQPESQVIFDKYGLLPVVR